MLITAQTFPAGKRIPKEAPTPLLAIYENLLRFNKPAAAMLGLPAKVAFDFDELFLELSPSGFQAVLSPSWKEHVVYSRPLARYAFHLFGSPERLSFEIIPMEGGRFRLKPLCQIPHVDTTMEEEIKNMLNVG